MLEPVNAYIPDNVIVNLIKEVYENGNETWYTNNREIANDYFGIEPYPHYAIEPFDGPAVSYGGHNTFPRWCNPPVND